MHGKYWIWRITGGAELSAEDKEFIRNYDPVIYFNDLECRYWAFDTKLPSGKWLENMKPDPVSKTISALVLK